MKISRLCHFQCHTQKKLHTNITAQLVCMQARRVPCTDAHIRITWRSIARVGARAFHYRIQVVVRFKKKSNSMCFLFDLW